MDRPTLQRALDSVAAQDYPNIEIVVAAALGDAHRDLPPSCGAFPLRLVRSHLKLQRADAANAALDAANGEWLNFLDDDDELLPHHVSTMRAALDANPHARLAHSQSEDVTAHGRFVRYHGVVFKPWRQLDTGFFHPHCAMFSRSLLDDGARFDARFEILEDMDFFVQCAQHTPFAFVTQPTTRYYVDAGDSGAGAGANRNELRLKSAIRVLREKWAALETRLRASPEFRGEQALWLLDQHMIEPAAAIIAGLLSERPSSADANGLAVLLSAARGEAADARGGAARWRDERFAIEDIAARLRAFGNTPS